ncbi:MAG: hypothetical protein HeimC2_13430 [Candidatus Heimdallarchaeota archaeon LC_2]|nr:MAG: hypothetical protein HeimC2_13430 [Candidatus Heimdallarchaeota archaeon LC_2]
MCKLIARMGYSEEINNNIKKSIANLSESSEYRVLEIFDKLQFNSIKYIYRDRSEDSKQDKYRELDFRATKIDWELFQESLGKTLKNYPVVDEPNQHMLTFVGDVKYSINYGKRIMTGIKRFSQDQSDTISLRVNSVTEFLSLNKIFKYEYSQTNFSKSISKVLAGEIDLSTRFPYPQIERLRLLDDKGDNSKKIIKDNEALFRYFEQITSGFFNHRKSQDQKNKDKILEVTIPTLVFGNSVDFLAGALAEYSNNEFEETEALLYHHQTSIVDPEYIGHSVPVLITSINNLELVIRRIEEEYFNPIWEEVTKYDRSD